MLIRQAQLVIAICFIPLSASAGPPPGFVTGSIAIGAPPAGVALDGSGNAYVVEYAVFGETTTKLHVVDAGGTIVSTATLAGEGETNLFVGGIAFDPVTQRALVTDNAGAGRLYSFDSTGDRQTIATGINNIAQVAVRSTGEIFVTTAPFGGSGEVLMVDRGTGATTQALGGLALGGGLAFEDDGDLIVQDVAFDSEFNPTGALRRLPIMETESGLAFGAPEPLIADAVSSYAVVITGPDEYLATGNGGLYRMAGSPLAESVFSANGNPDQFTSAIAFEAGIAPFEPFAGAAGGRVMYVDEAEFNNEDDFLTVLTPAEPTDFDSSGATDGADLAIWNSGFGAAAPARFEGDANADGSVTGADFLAWQRGHLGASSTSGQIRLALVAPEPATLLLAAICGAIYLARLRKRVH